MTTLIGQTLGKYQVIERLGRGGMADVYKGYQPGLDRDVAIKVMHPHLSEDPGFVVRFKREAKSVADLRHPHIVQVFDFDVQGENYYMVMEYIAGGQTLKQTLADLAARGERLTIPATLDIAAKLADALAYAHDRNMIHRDIKPANVLLPGLDRPVLSDFGIARLLGDTGLTSSGQIIGTPAYMSPEQGMGERGDARSDMYALGIVLYEMLTGRPPYDADTPYAVIIKHINDPITPPHALRVPMPDAVERIVMRCLAKNPDDRFASMAGLRDTLRSAMAALGDETGFKTVSVSEPVTVKAEPEAARAPAPRPKWLPVAALVGVIGLAVALIAVLRGQSPAGIPTADASTPFVESTGTPEPGAAPAENPEAHALVDQGYDALFTGGLGDAVDLFNRALAIEPDNPHALTAWAVAELSGYGDWATAAQYLDAAAPSIPDDPYLHYGYGLLYVRRDDELSDPQRSDAEFTGAIEQCGDRVVLCIFAHVERSGVRFWNLGDEDAGLADMDSAIALASDPSLRAYLHGVRADLRFNQGDAEGGVADYEEAYNLSQSPDYLEKAATLAVSVEDYDAALDFYQRLIDEQAGNPHHLVMRGYVEWQADEFDKALETAQRAIDLSGALEGHYLKGLLLLDAGAPQEALAELQAVGAVTDIDLLYQAGYPFLTIDFGHEIYYDIARAFHALGDSDSALAYLDQSIERIPDWPYPYIERGSILFEQGDLAGARENYLVALEAAGDDDELRTQIEELLAGLTQ